MPTPDHSQERAFLILLKKKDATLDIQKPVLVFTPLDAYTHGDPETILDPVLIQDVSHISHAKAFNTDDPNISFDAMSEHGEFLSTRQGKYRFIQGLVIFPDGSCVQAAGPTPTAHIPSMEQAYKGIQIVMDRVNKLDPAEWNEGGYFEAWDRETKSRNQFKNNG